MGKFQDISEELIQITKAPTRMPAQMTEMKDMPMSVYKPTTDNFS